MARLVGALSSAPVILRMARSMVKDSDRHIHLGGLFDADAKRIVLS